MHLAALAERIEQAKGPSRELDELIEKALPPEGPRCELPSLWNERAARFYGGMIGTYDDTDYVSTRYTASLDAAMTLVPEGADFTLDRITREAFVPCNASVLRKSGNAATPALALCAAALRARAAA